MNTVYYWIQNNKTKWYAGVAIICILILAFVKIDFWQGFAEGALAVSVIFFTWSLFTKKKNQQN